MHIVVLEMQNRDILPIQSNSQAEFRKTVGKSVHLMKIKERLLEHKKILFQFLSISKISFEFIVIVFLLFGIILAVSRFTNNKLCAVLNNMIILKHCPDSLNKLMKY